jgi:hypothetical protein
VNVTETDAETNSALSAKAPAGSKRQSHVYRLFEPQHQASGTLNMKALSFAASRRQLQFRATASNTDRESHPFARRTISRAAAPRPLSPKDREYLRSLREAEMSLWLAIQRTETAGNTADTKPAPPFATLSIADDKWEIVLLALLAAATLLTFFGFIGASIFH